MNHVTLRQLQVFASVVEHLSFTAAARALHLSQPAVSMQVKELENACGTPLLERMGRRIELTEAGKEVSECAATVSGQLRETRERLDALLGLKQGLLKLGAVSTAKYFAPALLASFQRTHPGITVRFQVSNREEAVHQLAENEIDLAIMGRPPGELETTASPFAPHPLIIVAARDHPLASETEIPLARVAEENFLIREPGSGTRAAMEGLFGEQDLAFNASMEVGSNETIKQAVIAGIGIAFISAHTAGLELSTKRLVALDVSGMPLMREWFVIHMSNRRLAPIATAFRDFILTSGSELIESAVNLPSNLKDAAG